MKTALISSILNLILLATASAAKGIGKTSEESLPGELMKHLRIGAGVKFCPGWGCEELCKAFSYNEIDCLLRADNDWSGEYCDEVNDDEECKSESKDWCKLSESWFNEYEPESVSFCQLCCDEDVAEN